MKDIDSLDPESNPNCDEWKTSSPEIFLTILLPELRTHLTAIQGYTTMLSDENMKEHHAQSLRNMTKNLQSIEKLCDDMAEYRNELMSRHNT